MTYKEMNAGILLLGAVLTMAWVALDALSRGAWQQPAASISESLSFAIFVGVVFNIAASITVGVVTRGRLKDERADERDRAIGVKAMRNAYFVAMVGGAASLAIIAWGPDNALGAYALYVTLALAGVTDSSSRLYHYRFGRA